MGAMKEATGRAGAGEEREIGAKNAAMQAREAAAEMKVCHPSVCVGSQKPTNCICPAEKK